MRHPPSPRFRLREATHDDHERVDAAFDAFRLDDRDGYTRFLTAQAAAFLPVEAAIDRAGAERVLPDWPARRRGGLLRDDLAELGVAPTPADDGPALAGDEAVLGAIYVLEGSRLGGRMLARSVGAGLPRRFVDAEDDGRWQTLVAHIDARLREDDRMAAAIGAARAVFARFEASARREGETACP